MKKCPVCNCDTLIFHKSEMEGFSWTQPYVKCVCGFYFYKKFENTGLAGITGFENEMIQKEIAESQIKKLFKIT